MGDMNIDWLRRQDAMVKRYKDFCRRNGLENLITIKTHTDASGLAISYLDHFLCNNSSLFSQHSICVNLESDHHIIYASRKKFKIKHPKVRILARSYSKYDPDKFSNDYAVVYIDMSCFWAIFG